MTQSAKGHTIGKRVKKGDGQKKLGGVGQERFEILGSVLPIAVESTAGMKSTKSSTATLSSTST